MAVIPQFRGESPMRVLDYSASRVEEDAVGLARARAPFGLRIVGWRRTPIRAGLRPYLKYRAAYSRGERRPLIALAAIPFAIVSPTFWMICVRAEMSGMLPRIEHDLADSMTVIFNLA